MLFNSFTFLVFFLPVTLAIYHPLRIAERQLAAKLFLVAASLFFYGWWEVRYVALIVISICANYAVSLMIERRPDWARAFLVLGLAGNLTLLAYYKYFNFFVSTIDALSGLDYAVRTIFLPLAISFFTFQQIAYLIEVYKDRKAADSFLDYSLFVLFFPHLIAGPITHHKEMLPQFKEAGHGPLPWSHIVIGSAIFVLGLAKKVVFADTLAGFADPVFLAAETHQTLGVLTAWNGALAYTFQLYFDFSGYSDMAIGLGLLFGIRLPVNFASPYKSTNIIEFWRRWHISLSRFLRNYLYIPLGGNRHGPIRRYANLFATMVIGGLWHGAGWTFVCWGALHGLYLAVNHAFRAVAGEGDGPARRAMGWLLTFLAVVVAWVLFRAASFPAASAMLQAMAGAPVEGSLGVTAVVPTLAAWLSVAAAAFIAFFSPSALEMTGYPTSVAGAETETAPLEPVQWRLPGWTAAAAIGIALAFAIARLPDPGVFLYFNF